MARDGRVLLVTDAAGVAAGRRTAPGGRWRCRRPIPFVAPIVYAAPVQLLAYHAAVAQGHRRRPAAQPREVGDGGMTLRQVSAWISPLPMPRTAAVIRSKTPSLR